MSKHTYLETTPSPDKRALAEAIATECAYILRLPPLTVRFYRMAAPTNLAAVGDALLDTLERAAGLPNAGGGWRDADDVAGLARACEPTVIWVSTHLAPLEMALVVAHEVYHRAQYAHPDAHTLTVADSPRLEREANDFAAWYVKLRRAAGESLAS